MTTETPRIETELTSEDFERLLAIDRSVREFIALGSGLSQEDVIPTYDKGPTPKDSFAMSFLITLEKFGTGIRLDLDSDDDDHIKWRTHAAMKACYQIEWFRENAQHRASFFMVWADSDAGKSKARELGFTVLEVHPLNRLDELDESDDWEERVQLDFDIGYCNHVTSTAERLRSAEFDVLREGIGGEIVEETRDTADV